MAIDATHYQYEKYLDQWQKIVDITDIENVTDYLVALNPQDNTASNKERNKQYQERAVFYPIAQYMLNGLHSMLFSKTPELNVPVQLEYLAANCDGNGNSIYQQSRRVAHDLIRLSRSAICVNFPRTSGGVSMADIVSGNIVATIQSYDPAQVVNWRKKNIGARSVLSLVVIKDITEVIGEDGYSTEQKEIYREMFLNESGFYAERIWEKDDKKKIWVSDDPYIPLDGSGNPWNEIPFTFIGAMNNDVFVDNPLMLGMVDMNIGHYRNSADYEDSVWFCGQAQPFMTGITQDHLDMLKNNNMYIGSREMIGVPSGESFGFAQANPNPMVRQAMLDKIDLMVMMGARLLKPTGQARTATEVAGEEERQRSALSLISSNLSEAYTKAINWCGRYMNVDTNDAGYKTTQEFQTDIMTSDQLRVIIEGFVQGAIPAQDYHNWLKKHDLTDKEQSLQDFMDGVNTSGSMPNLNNAA
jgi:hypothetical protein